MRWQGKKKQSGEETHRIVSGNYRKPTAKKAHRKQNESNEIIKKNRYRKN